MPRIGLWRLASCVLFSASLVACNGQSTAPPGAPAASEAAGAANGMIFTVSPNDVVETLTRIDKMAAQKGWQSQLVVVSTNSDPKAPKLAPTRMIFLNNTQIDTLLVRKGRTFALELPIKVLAYQDAQDKVMVGYSDPVAMAKRHGIDPKDPIVVLLSDTLRDLVKEGVVKSATPASGAVAPPIVPAATDAVPDSQPTAETTGGAAPTP